MVNMPSDTEKTDPFEHDVDAVKPLTAEQAAHLRRGMKVISTRQVVIAQWMIGLLISGLTWLWTGSVDKGFSVAWGSISVALPATVFAMQLQAERGGAIVRFFVGELIKVGMTIVLLVMAPAVISNVSWLALVAGLIVTIHVYLVAGYLQSVKPKIESK